MTKGFTAGEDKNGADKKPDASATDKNKPANDTANNDGADKPVEATPTEAQPIEVKAPAAEQDNAPAATAPVAPQQEAAPAEQKPSRLKKFLSGIFNKASLTSMGAGAVVGVTVKVAAIAAFGSPLLAIGIGAVAIGLTRTAVARGFDIHNHNKVCLQEGRDADKASFVKDFFNAGKTGDSAGKYGKQLLLATVCAGVGGVIGFNIADWFNGPSVDSTPTVPADDLNAILDQPPVDDGTVVVDPVVEDPAPVVEEPAPVVEEPAPVVEEPAPVVEEPAPVVEEPAPVMEEPTPVVEEPAPVVEEPAPVVEEPAPVVEEPAPVVEVVPTLDERVGATMEEIRSLLPADPGRAMTDVLNRIDSTNDAVRAQALKDLGYFFANGFRGVVENDVVANKLYELSLEVSGGNNMQAAHDLGYHLLYGKGTDVDLARAHELLSQSSAGGNKLSAPMLQYMDRMGLSPKP
ncbi:MAG: hypothetical protein KKA05_00265 [Alphaproteobacteria bacterium]|nr:hypothetical protein [Alphaproteobacteria bacterium]MBU0859390.1 hypothetical protein [Alphaproteobacteria bacterium]